MRRFWCDQCGQTLFFESTSCTHCGTQVGFESGSIDMISLKGKRTSSLFSPSGDYEYCNNGVEFSVCNWLVPSAEKGGLCWGCRFNRTIPDLAVPGNIERWRRFELAKKRLLYSLVDLGLPITDGWSNPQRGLLFDFIEDQRSNPVLLESFVSTGYLGGVITINALEADDVAREEARLRMNESYRTLLGHLRHESGHYYYSHVDQDAEFASEFQRLFGDASLDYQAALDRHYQLGPAEHWNDYYISSYASCHPLEDWAECWSHYLHIRDTLETAAVHGMVDGSVMRGDFSMTAHLWRGFTVTLNELNRSIGLPDAYPFVINRWVESKLAFVGQVIEGLSRCDPAAVVQ
jgi:hypothetical protein